MRRSAPADAVSARGCRCFVERLALASIEQSLANLRGFPCVRMLEERNKIGLHGAYFDISTGVLMRLDHDTGRFVAAVPSCRAACG